MRFVLIFTTRVNDVKGWGAMTDYQEKVLEAIQSGEDGFNQKVWRPKSLYESVMAYYQDGAKALGYEKIDDIYPTLRTNGFRVTSEEEAITYVCKVGHLHKEKFKALYLLDQNKELFESDSTLVIWGCGVGLDLFAFHDAAMLQERPDLWVHVRHILLLDVEPWALNRAKESAEMLFPAAKIEARVIDLTSATLQEDLLKIELGDLHLTPRVHLISNVLDLLVQDAVLKPFCEAFKVFTVNKRRANDYVLMFSPKYGDMLRNKGKVDPCVQHVFGTDFDLAIGETPQEDARTIYFSYRILDKIWGGTEGYKALFKHALFRNLRTIILDRLERASFSNASKTELDRFWQWATKSKLDLYYDFVRTVSIKNGDVSEDVLFFAPKKDSSGKSYRPLVYCSNVSLGGDYYKSAERIIQACGDDEDRTIARKFLFVFREQIGDVYRVIWTKVEDEGRQQLVQTSLSDAKNLFETAYDFNKLFFLQASAELLPQLEVLDKEQRAVALGRRKLRKIRGSAGSGKTVAMLWHGILAYKRTHLPILFLGKTNSLLSINSHKFASAFGKNSIAMGNDQVTFMTLNNFMCKVLGSGPCAKLSESEKALPSEERAKKMKELQAQFCSHCNQEAIECVHQSAFDCGKIKKYGAVLVDEAQISEPEIVEAIYKVTAEANPFREFYLFCDEQQSLHKCDGLLEKDSEQNGKMVVKPPAVGFGRFITLKGAHRFRNKTLLMVAEWIQQQQLSEAYDISSLAYDKPLLPTISSGPTLFQKTPFKIVKAVSIHREQDLMNDLIGQGSLGQETKNAVVVMFDRQDCVTEFTKEMNKKLSQFQGWKLYSTHGENERQARKKFREYDKTIHLSTIDCMQGHTFSKVLFVINRLLTAEELFTACTRARDMLYILDGTPNGVYYELLKHFN